MSGILALSWEDPAAAAVARRIITSAKQAGYAPAAEAQSGWVGVCGPRAPKLHDLRGGLLVLGDLFEVPAGGLIGTGGRRARMRALVANRWGRYVALDRDGDGRLCAVLRDPSGAFEVALWLSSGVQVVSTGTPDWLMAVAPAPVTIDWEGVPALLADPDASLTQPPLLGLTVLDAGETIDLITGAREQLWRPAWRGEPDVWDADIAGDGLRDRVDACVTALAGEVAAPGAEVSGGLDSAIVAVALGGQRERVRLWLNAYSVRPETDERRYARRVGEKLGFSPEYLQRIEQALEASVLARTSGGVRPGLNGADPVFDALVAEACRTAGVDGLFTGKGGDALFYQGDLAPVFTDLWRARGVRSLLSPVLTGAARDSRRSVWSLIGQTRRPDSPRGIAGAPETLLAGPPAPLCEPRHPWMHGADVLGPAKRMQLAALTSNLAYATACRRTEAVDLIHPLMAQPLVEWAMRIPTPILTAGRTDRFLARSAYAADLPPEVAWRRSKGDYTATFEREAAASLSFMREHLLEGLLMQHGVIDRQRTEALLDRDRLMWAGGSLQLTTAVLVESWLRCWRSRTPVP